MMLLLVVSLLSSMTQAGGAVPTQLADAAQDCVAATDETGVQSERLLAAGWTMSGEGEVDHLPQASFSREDRNFAILSSTFSHLEPSQCGMTIKLEDQADYALIQQAIKKRFARDADKVESRLVKSGQPETIPEYFWTFPKSTVELWMMPTFENGPDKPTVFISVIPKKENAE